MLHIIWTATEVKYLISLNDSILSLSAWFDFEPIKFDQSTKLVKTLFLVSISLMFYEHLIFMQKRCAQLFCTCNFCSIFCKKGYWKKISLLLVECWWISPLLNNKTKCACDCDFGQAKFAYGVWFKSRVNFHYYPSCL